jgi:hypothetical protein
MAAGMAIAGLTGLPQMAMAQRVVNPSPAQGATEVEPLAPVSASFEALNGVGVKPESLRVYLDDRDVTNQSVVTQDFFSYRPSTELSEGDHDVLLEFTSTDGRDRRVTWSFTVSRAVAAQIESVTHNGADQPIAAGDNLLITVQGTPASKVTVFVIQDGQQVQSLTPREVASGVYVVNAQVDEADRTDEGIVLARLEHQGQVKFATSETPLQLVTGATAAEQLDVEDVDGLTAEEVSDPLQPVVTNFRDGDRVSGSSFTVEGTTMPNASVKVEAVADTSLAGIVGTRQNLANTTIQADAEGKFTIKLRPLISAPGSSYTINMTGMSGGKTSEMTTLKLVQS